MTLAIFKIALRNLTRRKFRTGIAVLAIVLAVSLYMSLSIISYATLIASLQAFTEHIGDFDILVYKTKGSPFFNATNVTSILQGIDGISVVGTRLLFGALIVLENSFIRTVVVGLNLSQESNMGYIEAISGNVILGNNRCLVLSTIADNKIRPNQNITIAYKDINGNIRMANLTVSAIINQHGKLPSDIKSAIFIDITDAQRLFGCNDSANMIFIKLNPNLINPFNIDESIKNIIEVCEEIQTRLGFEYSVTPIKALILETVSENIESQRTMLNVFVSITVIMAILLIIMTTTMNLNERIREIGILRSLGASKLDIFLSSLVEIIIIGIIGGIIGILMGIFVSGYLSEILIPPGLHKFVAGNYYAFMSPMDILYAILLGEIVALMGGLYPAVKASRISPIEALQPTARRVKYLEEIEKRISPEATNKGLISLGIGIFGTASLFIVVFPVISTFGEPGIIFVTFFLMLIILLVSILLVSSGMFPLLVKAIEAILTPIGKIWGHIARGNILRYKHRALLIFFMLSLSVSSLFLVSILVNTQEKTIELSIKVQAGAEVVLYAREPLPENITEALFNISGVKDVCPVTYSLASKVGDLVFWRQANVKIYGIDPVNYSKTAFISDFGLQPEIFNALLDNDTVIISKGLADLLDVSVGDKIRIEVMKKTFILKVVGIISIAPGFTFTKFASKAAATSDILVSLNTFQRISKSIWYSRIFIKVSENADPVKVANDIQNVIGEDYDIQVIAITEYLERTKEALERLESIIRTLFSFAVLVSLLGEVLSIITTVTERMWEIGVLRAVGASRADISKIFAVEIFIISILSYIVGTIGAIIVATEFIDVSNMLSEITTPMIIPYDLMISVFLIIVVPSSILAILLGYKYASKNISEVLSKAERV